MPSPAKNPHLPFGDQRTAPWYGKDIISVVPTSSTSLGWPTR